MSKYKGKPEPALNRSAWGWWVVVGAVAAWLLWMTLRSQAAIRDDLAPLITTAEASGISVRFLIGIVGNIVVFVPFGAAVALALWGRLRRTPGWSVLWGTFAGASLSALIELLQRLSPSRFSDWKDWILNTLGALLGALGVFGAHALRRGSDRRRA